MIKKTRNNDEGIALIAAGRNSRDIFSYPVMAHDHVIYVGPLSSQEENLEKIQLIRTASPDDTIRLIINSPGGYVSIAMAYISAISESSARIVTHAEGTVASAGTLLWLSCEEKTVAPMTEFMFHNYQGYADGDGANMHSQVTFAKKYFDRVLRKFYTGVLSEEEISRIISGGQVWLDEEDIVKRTNAVLLSKEYLDNVKESALSVECGDNEPVAAATISVTLKDGSVIRLETGKVTKEDLTQFSAAELKDIICKTSGALGVEVKGYSKARRDDLEEIVLSLMSMTDQSCTGEDD